MEDAKYLAIRKNANLMGAIVICSFLCSLIDRRWNLSNLKNLIQRVQASERENKERERQFACRTNHPKIITESTINIGVNNIKFSMHFYCHYIYFFKKSCCVFFRVCMRILLRIYWRVSLFAGRM